MDTNPFCRRRHHEKETTTTTAAVAAATSLVVKLAFFEYDNYSNGAFQHIREATAGDDEAFVAQCEDSLSEGALALYAAAMERLEAIYASSASLGSYALQHAHRQVMMQHSLQMEFSSGGAAGRRMV